MHKVMKSVLVLAALAGAALGGSALADAAGNNPSATPSASSARPNGAPLAGAPGRHVGANGEQEQPLSDAVAAKVKAAALDKYPGATIERVETDVDHGSPYEAHLTTSDGKQLEVLVNKGFEVTDANAMMRP